MDIVIKRTLQKILNATDYIRFTELLHLFDKDNQHWILDFLNDFLEHPDRHEQWCIFTHESSKFVDISEEIFDIVNGFICIAKRLDNRLDGRAVWDVYGLERINQK